MRSVVIRFPLYPCRCLCRGFTQRMRTTPRRLTTLHFAQMGFTDDLTFMSRRGSLLESISDPPASQIIRRHLHRHFVAGKNADKMHAHFPRDMRENFVTVIELHTKHGIGQGLQHRTLNFNNVFLGHEPLPLLLADRRLPCTHSRLSTHAGPLD